MALVCTSCCVGHVRGSRKNDNKVAGLCSGVPSVCHIVVFRTPNICSQAISGMKLVWPTTTRVWDHSGDNCALKRNRGGRQRFGQWRAGLSNSADGSIGMNGERTGNGGIRTVALNRLEEVDSNVDDDSEGKSRARVADSSDTFKSKDISARGPASVHTGARSAESEQTSSYELSDLSTIPQSGRSADGQEKFLEQDKGFLEAEEENCVSLVWEAGSEIAKLSPEMASMKDRNDTEDQKFSLTLEEEQHRQERLRALEGILANFPESENDLSAREKELLAFSDKLMNQSALHEEELRRSHEALRRAEGTVFQLNTQVGQLMKDVASRDALLRLLQREASSSSESLQMAAQSLSDSERRITNLEKRVQTGEESLCEERDKLGAAIKSASSLEEAAKVAESKVGELTAEVSSLKALAAAGRRAEYLSAQVHALEKELRSRDSLLLEIKAETKRSTEALTVAAQIKQDLNAVRQREVQLTQALQGSNNRVKELETELLENLRSVRAEQALKQMEKMLRDANLEIQLLRRGVEERDKAIYLMKDEVDLSINLLNSAARDREELHKIKLQMEDLKADLGSKENKLKIVREEMASVINLARQKQSTLSRTSSSDPTSLPAARSNPSVQVSKPKKKLKSKKQTSSGRSSESSPQCS